MGIVGVVVLSLIAGLFLAILIAAVIFLIWVCLKLRQTVTEVMADLSKLVQLHDITVKSFQSEITQAISRINGDGLASASKSILSSAQRIEKACVAFGELAKFMLADRDTISSNGAGLAPDEFATPEPGEQFISLNPTAAADRQALAEDES